MKFREILKKTASAFIAMLTSAVMMIGVSAAGKLKDYEMDVSTAPVLDPWGSFSITSDHYDHTKLTKDTEVIVTFDFEYTREDGKEMDYAPVEFIVQSWSNPDSPFTDSVGKVWGRVEPYEYDETHAVFKYEDMVKAYGTSDFSDVDALNIGSTEFGKIKLKSCVMTNCGEDIYIAMTDAERAEKYKNLLIIVLAVSLFIIISIIVIFMIILRRKTKYAYNVATGEYVKMK